MQDQFRNHEFFRYNGKISTNISGITEIFVLLSMQIIKRLLAKSLLSKLNKGKVLVITGARQVGKTTLVADIYNENNSLLWLNADEQPLRERLTNPSLETLKSVIGNYKIVVIDEIQRIINPGLLLKLMVDNFKNVQFIATGSSALDISETVFEPLTGRQFLFHLYPFSMIELYRGKSAFEWEKTLPFHLIFGSYPNVVNEKPDAEFILSNLSDQYLYKDILVWKDIRKPQLLESLLKLLAYQVCSEVSYHELAKTLCVKAETIESYINLLEKAFVVFRLNSFSTNPRKEVSKMSKIYFWDNGIRNSIIDDFNPLEARNDQGKLWENFIVSERIKLNSYRSKKVKSYFWRNYNQSEIDYVEVDHDKLSGFEMKWNTRKSHSITKAFRNAYPEAETEIISPQNFVEFISD